MKFLLFLLLTAPAFADVEVCNQFVNSVLKPAVTFDEKADDHGYRFERNEEKALTFMRNYDVSKLQIPEELRLAESEMTNCKAYNNPKKNELYCGSLFENFNYLRGLIYGSRNYKWKSSTVELANKKLNSFLHETTIPGIPLIHLALSYALLEEVSEDKKVKNERAELEKAISKLQAEAKKNTSTDCPTIQKGMKAERKVAEPFRVKLAALLKEMKK